jgi:exopolysaccharide biosynthesis polyprenyl glycosylphosphotransferase
VIRLFRVFIPASVVTLLASEFLLVVACYFAASLFTTYLDPLTYLFDEGAYWKLLLMAGLIIGGMYLQDLYSDLRVTSRVLVVQQVCLSVGAALLIMAFFGYLVPDLLLGRWLMIMGSVGVVITMPLWRIFYWRYVIAALRSERVLLLGNAEILREVSETVLAKPEFGYNILGYLCEQEPSEFPVPCLGRVADIRRVYEEQHPTRIVVGMSERRNRLPVQDLLEIRFEGVLIEDAADTFEVALRRVSSRQIQPSQLIFTSALGPRPKAIAFQNIYSYLIGALGLVLFLPLMLLTALAVKISSKGPILYRQHRVGVNGKLFYVYKFRSMYVDAEARTGAVWAKKNDPRITAVGKWLRKLRLDELPQFWNVVRGDMAIVGPRPERPEFVEILAQQIPYYRQRLAVKPGITGWAQINHKYGDTALDAMIKLEYDLYYIKHIGAALDLYIIFHTVKVMLLSRGAQ